MPNTTNNKPTQCNLKTPNYFLIFGLNGNMDMLGIAAQPTNSLPHSFFAYANKGHYTQYNITASESSQMKKITRQETRDKIVGSILGSLRIEDLQPSTEVIAGMKACIAGQDTTQHLLEQAKKRHAKIHENNFHS